MKKIISVLLAVIVLVSMLSITVHADDSADAYLQAIVEADTLRGKVYVTVKACQPTTNGRLTVEYNSSHVYYAEISAANVLLGVNDEAGKLSVGYAVTDGEPIQAGEELFKITFNRKSGLPNQNTVVKVMLEDFNHLENSDIRYSDTSVQLMVVYVPQPDPKPETPAEPETPVEPEITVDPDGTVTEVVKNEDGSTTTTVETPAGTTATTVTNEEGVLVEAAVEIPKTVEKNETVVLPVEMTAAATSEEAARVDITVPADVENVVIEIPVAEVTPTSVVVLVHEDGTEEIVSKTAMTESGLSISVDSSVTVKVVDNAKEFKDDDMWAKDAIAFVTSRQIFNGTSADTFDPNGNMTRVQLMTVLARLDGTVVEGAEWKEQGMEWAKENGVSDGTNPDGTISREQLATMLYRYAGEPETNGSLTDFTDADSTSDYAQKALQWAVENGLISGMGNNILNPKGAATRAQLAKIMMYFINL